GRVGLEARHVFQLVDDMKKAQRRSVQARQTEGFVEAGQRGGAAVERDKDALEHGELHGNEGEGSPVSRWIAMAALTHVKAGRSARGRKAASAAERPPHGAAAPPAAH